MRGTAVAKLRSIAAKGLAGAMMLAILALGQPAHALERLDFTVTGAPKPLETSLRAASGLLAAERDKATDPQDLFAVARAEYGRLLGALYSAGHYSGVIRVLIDGREAAEIAPLDAPGQIGRIEVQVTPGPTFTFSRAVVQPLARGTALPKGFAPGKVAESGLIQEAVSAGVDGWRSAGHAKATPSEQEIVADHATAGLSAAVTLDPGPKLRFGRLAVSGQERMRERPIRRIAGLKAGEVFSPKALTRSAERLRRTGVFKSVTLVEADQITPPDTLGIEAQVVEDKRRRYSFGAEIASSEGATLSGYWLHRNLLGGAERLRIDAEIANLGAQNSGVDYSLGASLERPATLNSDTTLVVSAKVAHLDEVDYSADLLSLGLGLTYYRSEALTYRAGLGYEYSEGSDRGDGFLYRSFTLPLGATWDRRDNKVDATRGTYLAAEAKPFLGLGTTGSGVRLTADARAYRGFGAGNRVVLAGRFQAGAIYGSSLLDTPREFLFYSGGGGTVRGQPYQSLGVDVLRGPGGGTVRTGGTFFLGGSAEARVKVTDNIGVVGFVDAGQISVGSFGDDAGEFHAGAGFGLRYATGFGPLRLDVAGPVGGNTGKGVQIYIGIGQAF